MSWMSSLAEHYGAALREDRYKRLSRFDNIGTLVPDVFVVSEYRVKGPAIFVTQISDKKLRTHRGADNRKQVL